MLKKLFTTLLVAGTFALTACQANISSGSSKNKLTSAGYTVEVYSEAEAKVRIANLNYEGVSFTDALYAEKGTGENKDLLIAIYFPSIDAADSFVSKNNHENLGLLNSFGDRNLGENLTKKVGVHNNVAYVGSVTSFAAAF